jgi:26S proteasome regulatory subunit N2
MGSVVGLAIWAQHWFWYPMFHFLELSFQPTYLIGLNKDLKLPKDYGVHCNAKKSLFATPKRMEEKKEEKKELVATAVLSTTAKAKARQAKHDAKEKKPEPEAKVDTSAAEEKTEAMEVDSEGPAATEDKAAAAAVKKVKEASTHTVKSPARVTSSQEQFMAFDVKQRYIPVMYPNQRAAGVVVLRDTTPSEQEDVEAIKAPTAAGAEEEAEPPLPFEWEPPQ